MGRKETYRESAFAESVDPDDSGLYIKDLVFVADGVRHIVQTFRRISSYL